MKKNFLAQSIDARPFSRSASRSERTPNAAQKRLSRSDLLEVVARLQDECDRLEQENHELRLRLEDRRTHLSRAGSIAEATVALNDLFATAQRTADDYLAEIAELRDAWRAKTGHFPHNERGGGHSKGVSGVAAPVANPSSVPAHRVPDLTAVAGHPSLYEGR